jgi:hypothetical protein
VFGVWCLVFGVWCLVFGVWCSETARPFPSLLLAKSVDQLRNCISLLANSQHTTTKMTDGISSNKSLLDQLSPTVQFSVLAVGVFLFFGIHNFLQEAMMNIPGFEFGVMLGYLEVLG